MALSAFGVEDNRLSKAWETSYDRGKRRASAGRVANMKEDLPGWAKQAGARGKAALHTARTVGTQVTGDIGNAARSGVSGAARATADNVGGYSRVAGRDAARLGGRGLASVKLHPVRAGAIGGGVTAAGAGGAYAMHRHNRSKLDD